MGLLVGFRIFAVLATFCGVYISMFAELARSTDAPWYLLTANAVGALFVGMLVVIFGVAAVLTVPMEVYVLKRCRRLVFGAHLALLGLVVLYAVYLVAAYLVMPDVFEGTKFAESDERSGAERAVTTLGYIGLLYYIVWFVILVPFLVIARFSPQPNAIASAYRPTPHTCEPTQGRSELSGPSVWEISAPLSVPATIVGFVSMMQSYQGDKFLGQLALGCLLAAMSIAGALLFNYARQRRLR